MTATQPGRKQSDESPQDQMATWWSRLDRGWKAATLGLIISATELMLSLP